MQENTKVDFSILSVYAKTVILWIRHYHYEIDKKGFTYAGGKCYNSKQELRKNVELQLDTLISSGELTMDIGRDEALKLMYP